MKIKIKSQISKEVTVIAEALGVTAKLVVHHLYKNLILNLLKGCKFLKKLEFRLEIKN